MRYIPGTRLPSCSIDHSALSPLSNQGHGFTAIALLSLMLGIGVNTAIFTVIDAVLFNRFR